MQEEKAENEEKSSGEFVPKYQKPKILLIDLPEETLSLVQSAGFNAVSASFGTPYTKPNNNYLPVIPNDHLPDDYTEQEVIIIDLTLSEKIIPYPPGDIKGAERENYLWIQSKQDKIDPRPVAMDNVKYDFDRILIHGGLFVIFAQPRFNQEVFRHKGTSIVLNSRNFLNNWDFLSRSKNLPIEKDSGREISVLDGDTQIFSFLRKNITSAQYTTNFGSAKNMPTAREPILINKFGDCVSELLTPIEDSNGKILILPQMLKKPEIVKTLLKEVLPEISPHLFPYAESINWVTKDEYEISSVNEYKSDKIAVQKDTQKKLEELDKLIEKERNKYSFVQEILTATGEELVVDIKKCLELIGFKKVVNVDEKIQGKNTAKQKQEDLQVLDKSPVLLIEIKGLTGVPQEADIMQVFKYVSRRMRELDRTDVRGIFIVNHQRNLPPLSRGKAFAQQQEKDAKSNDITILTSWDLFLLIKGAIKWGWDHKIIREFFYQAGRTSRVPSIYKPLGKVVRYYDKKGVIEIEIAENELHKGQHIGYITPTGYLEETVSSLQVKGQDVKEATPSQIADIKTKYDKNLLRKGSTVYIIPGADGDK